MHAACERARQWVSAEVDGELSRFERVLLAAHTANCSPCRDFHAGTVGFTSALRAAPIERPERLIEIGRTRRRVRARLAPAVAAMAVAAVGLGSILASSDFRFGSVGSVPLSVGSSGPSLAAVDTINLGTVRGLERAAAQPAARAGAAQPQRAGGPLVQER